MHKPIGRRGGGEGGKEGSVCVVGNFEDENQHGQVGNKRVTDLE